MWPDMNSSHERDSELGLGVQGREGSADGGGWEAPGRRPETWPGEGLVDHGSSMVETRHDLSLCPIVCARGGINQSCTNEAEGTGDLEY